MINPFKMVMLPLNHPCFEDLFYCHVWWNRRVISHKKGWVKFPMILPWLTGEEKTIQQNRSKPIITTWLVVDLPLRKIWVHQLGWWQSQLNGKIKIMFQTTNPILGIHGNSPFINQLWLRVPSGYQGFAPHEPCHSWNHSDLGGVPAPEKLRVIYGISRYPPWTIIEYMNNCIYIYMYNVGHRLVWWPSIEFFPKLDLYCGRFFLRSVFFRRSLIHLSLGKAGPFTLENHIHVEALKMQGFPNNEMPY